MPASASLYLQPKPPGTKPPGVAWALTGQNRFELIDDDHDGHPEFLHIEVGVQTNASACKLEARLYNDQFLIDLSMRETETPGIFSAYVPGSELYFTYSVPPGAYSLRNLRATCEETANSAGWLAWGVTPTVR